MRRTVIDTYKSMLRAYYGIGEIPIVGPALCTVLALSAYAVVLLFLLIPVQWCFAQDVQLARLSPAMVGGGVPAAGASCPADGSPDYVYDGANADKQIGIEAGKYYIGTTWNSGTERTICKIGFELYKSAGDISGKTFYVELWTKSGNNLDALVTNGTSTGVAGNNSWDATWVYFAFDNHPVLSASTNYAVTISMHEVDADNYARIYLDYSGTSNETSYIQTWNSSKTYIGADDYEASLKVYYYD